MKPLDVVGAAAPSLAWNSRLLETLIGHSGRQFKHGKWVPEFRWLDNGIEYISNRDQLAAYQPRTER
jgi:hypothetical protein